MNRHGNRQSRDRRSGDLKPSGAPRQRERGAKLGASLAAGILAAALLAAGAPAAWAISAKERLAGDLEQITLAQLKNNPAVPEADKARTAKCLGQAIAADIPEPDAAKLVEMAEGRAALDKALEQKWIAISKKTAPARYSQVMAAVQKTCPDLGPYVEPML